MIMRIACVITFIAFLGGYSVYEHVQSVSGFKGEKIGQFISKPFWSVSTFMSSSSKEQEVGESLKEKYFKKHLKKDSLQKYLTKLNDQMTKAHNPKGFKWSIYAFDDLNNAFALPGGVIVIGRKLISSLKTEAELVAIIAHERGHVDLGHSMTVYQNSFRVFYSKLQEEQADDYAFDFLIKLGYDPEGLPHALTVLKKSRNDPTPKNTALQKIMPTIFESHPSLEMRIEQQKKKALSWKKKNLPYKNPKLLYTQ